MIFCKATKFAARNVKDISENFCNISGQLVNKSTVQFSKGIERKLKMDIVDILQVDISKSIGTYLGYRNINHKRTRGVSPLLRKGSEVN